MLLSLNSSINAQQVNYKNVQLDFNDHWDIQRGQNDELIALQQKEKKAFILSIYYPQGIEEGMQYLVSALEVPKQNLMQTEGVKLVQENVKIQANDGMSFQANVFTVNSGKRFLITASLGSNAGVLLTSYEGQGHNISKALAEFKVIAESLSLSPPDQGFLFSSDELNP